MIIVVGGIINADGSVSFPDNVEVPNKFFECLCHEGTYYFFSTKQERDTFYDERGIPHE